MRANVTPSPVRNGKRRLLSSCAIAAGIAALAYGGPALAQVAGSGTVTSLPGGSTSNTGANPSTINVNGAQTIIDWTPSNTPVGGVIDFLPSTNNLTFVGNTQNYIVLNRFVGTGTNQIGINGTVNSFVNVAGANFQDGNIWFYNAGGILIGSTGVFNVGSLVLTSNNIDTTGGLLDPGTGAIRFRGTSGSIAPVTMNGEINASRALAPAGSSYVALVAPRVNQAGAVTVNGSAAYVAAEQADITIRTSGLFDINVTVGAEGGTALTHSGTTTGPEQQASGRAQRIYMVAIPKNVAVGMLVSGDIGYTDSTSAITNSDGSVVLSAGYNVTNGAINTAPVNATAANLTINDTLFRSDVLAHASGAFVGQPLLTVPPVGGPSSGPGPQQIGRIVVQGSGTFIGDTSATLNVNAGRQIVTTGALTVQSGGVGSSPGSAAVNVNGGQLLPVGGLSILANGHLDAATGNVRGGNAALSITGGGVVQTTSSVLVSAVATGGIGSSGAGGTGTGGTADITIGGVGSRLTADAVTVDATGVGGGVTVDSSGIATAVDNGGNGQGGTATLTVTNAGNLTTTGFVQVNAFGAGELGNVQSGNGTGGTARISITGAGNTVSTPGLFLNVSGFGGGVSQRYGVLPTASGGDGRGGTAELLINTDDSSALNIGDVALSAAANGGGARNSENTTGGDAFGGTVNVTIDGGADVAFDSFNAVARADSGGATSPSGLTALSGNARGGNVNMTVTGGSELAINDGSTIDASGTASTSENVGSGTGGNIVLTAINGGVLGFDGGLNADAFGGSQSAGFAGVAGSGTGGNIDLIADLSGTISAANYNIGARANVVNSQTSTGIAQGGRITLSATNGGTIVSTNDGNDLFGVGASTGFSQAGASATGGSIELVANEGSIALANVGMSASGISGGALGANSPLPVGTGGTILIRTGFDSSSSMSFATLSADADGATQAFVEGTGGQIFEPAGNGQGGSITIQANGGDFSAGGPINISANGNGGIGRGTTGRGGSVVFTQIGGAVSIGNLNMSADGYGGFATALSGDGYGGDATLNLLGGTFDGGVIEVSASGIGGEGYRGNNFDPANPELAGDGGDGIGGTVSINIGGDAVINTLALSAYAEGDGGAGGDFYNDFSTPGNGGNGGDGIGGNATINIFGGELNTSNLIVSAEAAGGRGGDIIVSSSSSFTGVGVGGNAGGAQGGNATLVISAAFNATNARVSASAFGADGGEGTTGGNGGDAFGGLAQVIVDNFDAGALAVSVESSATGGSGENSEDGPGGRGGSAFGGRARVEAIGEDARVVVSQANFITNALGGNGGDAGTNPSARPEVGSAGGDGGQARGGEIEIVATDGGMVGLGIGRTGGSALSSTGTGGNGGRGADNPGTLPTPGRDGIIGTPDDGVRGLIGGNGGLGGEGAGGSVYLFANGGTITSGGAPLSISVRGESGNGGDGGIGSGGNGFCCSGFVDLGGRVVFSARNTENGTGQIQLGDTVIDAGGFIAGRIEMFAEGNITMNSLLAEAEGFASPTNNDIDEQPSGIYFAADGGTIRTLNDMTLRTGSSFGAYVLGSGRVNAGGDLTIEAGDQVDLRHGTRGDATNATLFAEGDLSITAFNSLRATAGTIVDSDGTLRLTTNGPAGTITVDRIDGDDIFITSAGRASIEHAEAVNDFTADVGSFRTGLNSIITGGNINITSPGAVDLGNSTAGGSVFVTGQSILFANINAGFFVGLNATGTATGAEGIRGGSITAENSSVNLNANSITIETIQAGGFLSATATGGNVAITQATVDRGIGISATGNITGRYAAGEDIFLSADGDIVASASAIGDGGSSSSGTPTAASLYVDAGGNVLMTDSEASGVFGVNAGGSVQIDGATVGEDMLVIAGTTANLTDIEVGDDLEVRAAGDITATNVSATGEGPDENFLLYTAASGFTISQGEGNSAINGSDIAMTSATGSITATNLSAGDDINLLATNGNIAVSGATTEGLGTTGGGSNIRVEAIDMTLSNVNSFDDLIVLAGGEANFTGAARVGRNAIIDADNVDFVTFTGPGSTLNPTLQAGGNITINAATVIGGGGIEGDGDVVLTAGERIELAGIAGGTVDLDAADGISVGQLFSNGTTRLNSSDGEIALNAFNSAGEIDASANSISINNGGNLIFNTLTTDVGDAFVRAGGDLFVRTATVAGTADLRTSGESLNINSLTANSASLVNSNGFVTLNNVTAADSLYVSSGSSLSVNGIVTGRAISLESEDISIGATARVGTAGTTEQLSVINNNNQNVTYVGGTGTRNGYHIDAAELTRLFGSAIEIFAPEVGVFLPASVGSSAPPDVIVDSFTMTGGAPNAQGVPSNLGANGSLTIRTTGKMRVIGNVQLTGLSDNNSLNLIGDDSVEVILGSGSVNLRGQSADQLAGNLTITGEDIVIATMQAITDISSMTSTSAIDMRLAQNDGIISDIGALSANRITLNHSLDDSVYIQNSGAGTAFDDRRGITFGAGGLFINGPGNQDSLVINAVHRNANGGLVTGLSTIPLININAPSGSTTVVQTGFNAQSTINGCVIANVTSCSVRFDSESLFPVQDVIEDQEGDGDSDEGDGTTLPTALITMRDLDPLTGEPLLDDPVTGAGNDDLWTPTSDTQQP